MASEVRQWIEDSAARTAELTKTQVRLELKESQLEAEERTRAIIREEIQSYFGGLAPHEHASHHEQVGNWIDTRKTVSTAIVTKGVMWIIGVLMAGTVFLNSGTFALPGNKKMEQKREAQHIESVE